MAEEIKYIQYTSRIKTTAVDKVLVETDQIKDIAQNKFQKDINAEVKQGLAEVQKKIDNSIAGLYRLKGTKQTLAEVKALTGVKKGDVWNVAKGFTLNGRPYTDGTNVVATADMATGATEANWDALGGTISLEGLVSFPKERSTLTHDSAANTITLHWQKQGELGESSSTIGDIASQSKMTAELGKKVDATTYNAKVTELNTAIGKKVDATTYNAKVSALEAKDGQLDHAIDQQAKRIDKVQDVGIVAFTDLEASVTNIQQASVSLNFAICYAEMQNVFVAKTIENGVAKYYNNWPTAEMYNKDGVARADKLYMRFTNGTMVPYAYHPVMRKLVAIPAGMTSGTDSLENCIKKLETKDGELSTLIGRKADASAVYDRATVNRLLAAKQNTGNYVTAIGRMYPGGGPGLNVTLSSGAAQGVSVADNANESRDGYMSAADYKLLHQGVLKNSLLPEVYEQAHRNGRLQVTQTVTIPDYAKEIHILQSSNIEVRIPSAMQENGYGITFYCEGHTGTATIRSTVPMWYLDANGRIAQSNRLVMTFGSALCITWRGGSRTAIQLSPVPITPA